MDIEKLYRVIDSCETQEQLKVAAKYFGLWEQKTQNARDKALNMFEEKRFELS